MNEASTARRLFPVFIGIGLTILFLIGLAYLADRRRIAEPVIQSIDLLEPASGAAVDSPLVVRFATTAPLALSDRGWGTRQLHLHARVDGVEHMPAPADIIREDSVFVWTLPVVRKGPHTLRIGWANLAHRELSTGAAEVDFTLR
jgi:hypothetical protein